MSRKITFNIDSERLVSIMDSKNIKQEKLATTIFCTQPHISKIIKEKKITFDMLIRICDGLDIEPVDILTLESILCNKTLGRLCWEECMKRNEIDLNYIKYIESLGFETFEKHNNSSYKSIISALKFKKDNKEYIFSLSEFLNMQNNTLKTILLKGDIQC